MPLPGNDILVKLSDIAVSYGDVSVLQHFDMEVAENDFVVVTGANGGGKTTILRVMLKLLKPDCGRVQYFGGGSEIDALHIGYLPQKSMIDSRFPISVEDVVASGLYEVGKRFEKREYSRRVHDMLLLLGLQDLARRHIGRLSGGQLQRVLLGRAIISHPRLLVLDEPMSYLDTMWRERVGDILTDYARDSTIVMVTHNLEVVENIATKLVRVE